MKKVIYISRYVMSLQAPLYNRAYMEAKTKNAFKEEYLASCIIKGAMLAEIYEMPKMQREELTRANALIPIDFKNWVAGLKNYLTTELEDIKVNDLYNIFLAMYFKKQDREILVSRKKRLSPGVPAIPFDFKIKKTYKYKEY